MKGITATEVQDITLSVGTHRGVRRLSPLEVAGIIEKAVDAGTSRKECASALGIGPTQVGTFLKLLSLGSEIQHLADWRGTKNASVPFSTLAELARLPVNDQKKATEAVLRHDLRWKEVIQLTQIRDRSGLSIEECIESILKLRPQIETRHLFVGAITAAPLRDRLHSISQSDRDALLERILRRLTGPAYGAKGRLSDREFTVLSRHDLPKLLEMTADQIEQIVNDGLEDLATQA